MFFDFPSLGRNGGKSLGEKLDELGRSYCRVKSPSWRKKESRVAGRTRRPQFSFPACAQERLARFKLPFRRWLRLDSCFVLTKFRLKAEESRWRWTKRTIWGYRESKCRGNLKTNQRMFLWRSNRERFWTYEPCLHIFGGKLPKMVQTFHFLSFLVFFYFLACFYLTTTIYGTLHWRRLEQY